MWINRAKRFLPSGCTGIQEGSRVFTWEKARILEDWLAGSTENHKAVALP